MTLWTERRNKGTSGHQNWTRWGSNKIDLTVISKVVHLTINAEREQMKVRPMEASDSRYAIALISWPETRLGGVQWARRRLGSC